MTARHNRDFDKRLQEAAKTKLSPEDIRAQTVSFVMGTTSEKDAVTREKVKELVSKQYG